MKDNREKIFGVISEPVALEIVGESSAPQPRPATWMPTGFFNLAPLMQGETSECGGFALAQAINYLLDAPYDNLSGSFTYAYEKTVDGYAHVDGTTISALAKAGTQAGSCLETLFHDDGATGQTTSTLWSTVTNQAQLDGEKRLLGTPVNITDLSISGINDAIYKYGAVILELQVGNEWWTPNWLPSNTVPIKTPAKIVDGHFVMAGAYDETKNQTWFINSWSTNWGQNGFSNFGSNYQKYIVAAIAFNKIPVVIPGQPTTTLTPTQVSLWSTILTIYSEIISLFQQSN